MYKNNYKYAHICKNIITHSQNILLLRVSEYMDAYIKSPGTHTSGVDGLLHQE